jgi:hypothetical protein
VFAMLGCERGGELDVVTAVPRLDIFHNSVKNNPGQPAEPPKFHFLYEEFERALLISGPRYLSANVRRRVSPLSPGRGEGSGGLPGTCGEQSSARI